MDANIFFAAAASQIGASAFLFHMAQNKKVRLISNQYALIEAKVNIGRKLGEKELLVFYELISVLNKIDSKKINQYEQKTLQDIIVEKDIPILASAMRQKADFLITLDKKDFMKDRVRIAAHPVQILSPGEYLKKFV